MSTRHEFTDADASDARAAVRAIDAFDRECSEASYTDVDAAWLLLRHARAVLDDLFPAPAGDGPLAAFLADAGYRLVDTGGGCMAWRRDLASDDVQVGDPRCHDGRHVLITDGWGEEPDDGTAYFLIGVYDDRPRRASIGWLRPEHDDTYDTYDTVVTVDPGDWQSLLKAVADLCRSVEA